MPRRPSVPEGLRTGPFTRAEALAAGLTARQLDSACWRRLFRDVYVWRGLPDGRELRIAALALAVPDHAVVTRRTAAWLHGVLEPDPRQPFPLDVVTDIDRGRTRLPGVNSGRRRLDPGDVTSLGNLSVTSPLRTCFELMRTSPTLVEAVVAADAYLHAGLFTQETLQRYVDQYPGYRGVRQARTAVLLAHPGAESPGETRLRMVIVLAGLPEPELNWPLHDAAGTFVGRPDMLYLNPLFGIEYDGLYHADINVQAADHRRENKLLLANVPLLRYTARDVKHRPELIVHQIRTSLARRG
jgi:hypothetical protein